jgi:hypothetical protein
MGLQRSFGFFCDTETGINQEVVASIAVTGVDSVSTGPLVYQNVIDSTDPGAAFEYLSGGVIVAQAAFDPTATVESLRQVRASGKRPVCKSLFYALGDKTAVTDIDPGSTAAAEVWCQSYFTNVLSPLINPDLPFGAEFDILNIETELSALTRYPEAWVALIEEIRNAGFTGIITSSANDSSITNTPWAANLDWFGFDCYPPVSNNTYIGHSKIGNASNATQLTAFLRKYVADNVQTASHQFGGIPVFLGEFSFGIGPANAPASPVVPWSDYEWATLTESFFEALAPLDCWAGVAWWRWPYNDPNNIPAYPPVALLNGLSAGWTSYGIAPDPPASLQVGPRTSRSRHARTRTVLPVRFASDHRKTH